MQQEQKTASLREHMISLSLYNGTCCSFLGFVGARRGRDRMVVGFTTTYAISAYPH